MIFGSQVENTDLYREQASFASDWSAVYAYPKLKFSGVAEAMGYIAQQMNDRIPAFRGEGGPYWDIFSAGAPAVLARETEHRALAAEKFSTIASPVNPRCWPDRQAQFWTGMLSFQEQMGGSGGRTGTLRGRYGNDVLGVYNAREMEDVLTRGMSTPADAIQAPSGTRIVFQSAERAAQRTGGIQSPEEPGTRGPRDEAGRADRSPHQSASALRWRARWPTAPRAVPGGRCPTRGDGTANEAGPPASGSESTLANAYYRVVLAPSSGAVRSILDQELNRELVDGARIDGGRGVGLGRLPIYMGYRERTIPPSMQTKSSSNAGLRIVQQSSLYMGTEAAENLRQGLKDESFGRETGG